jgi:plastocyanin
MKLTFLILCTAALITTFIIADKGPQIFGITFAAETAPATAAASAAAPAAPAGVVEVKIDNFAFAPATITVPAGTSIRWINDDETIHNVVSSDKSFRSKALDTNEEFSFTFTKPGTYSYICSLHPRMTGKVIVE